MSDCIKLLKVWIVVGVMAGAAVLIFDEIEFGGLCDPTPGYGDYWPACTTNKPQ